MSLLSCWRRLFWIVLFLVNIGWYRWEGNVFIIFVYKIIKMFLYLNFN